ncbi:MAG: glucosamine-6-phosphate deaminase [Bdellovibrionota bacterium]
MIRFLTATQHVASRFVAHRMANRYHSIAPFRMADFCFATGSSPEMVYAELRLMIESGELDLSMLNTYNLDEYVGLPDDHPERYWNFMDRLLFGPANIPVERRHFPDPANPELYETQLRHYTTASGLDFALLGIGRDGHIAFNMPGSSFNSLTRVVDISPTTRQDNARFFDGNVDLVPKQAVTMGIGTICDLPTEIVLIAFGPGKSDIVRQAFTQRPTEDCPASALQQKHVAPKVTVIVGDGAEQGLIDAGIVLGTI